MDQTTTLTQLILYYFNETQLAETVAVQKAIDYHPCTSELYRELVATMAEIDRLMEEPSDAVVKNILNFSKISRITSLS